MADRKKERAQDIVQRRIGNVTPAAVSQYESIPGLDQTLVSADVQSADIDSLRRRYFGEQVEGMDAPAVADVEISDLDDPSEQMVDLDVELGPGHVQTKTFIVADDEDEVIGQQG